MSDNHISVQHLSVVFSGAHHTLTAVNDISLTFPGNKITGIIGESGCGKSVLAMSLIGLQPKNTRTQGKIIFNRQDLCRLDKREMRRLRQEGIALIPQDPDTSLNPAMKIHDQILEAAPRADYKQAHLQVEKRLDLLGLAGTGNLYPFQLSGGMRQRALTAMGLIRAPKWLLADEPTKGLDARMRYKIFKLLEGIHSRTKTGIILISHDLLFARRLCNHIAVLYCGKVMETGPASDFFASLFHPYSQSLLKALPRYGFTPVPGPAPSIAAPPGGCPFHPRCPNQTKICRTTFPPASQPGPGSEVYCHLYA